jgi:hypothetical protein
MPSSFVFFAAARIADVKRRESGRLDRALHFSKGTRGSAYAMEQDDAVTAIRHSGMVR